MGGRGSGSNMRSSSLSEGGSSSNLSVNGRININPKDLPLGSGIHQYTEGTVYFGTGTSKSKLIDHIENSSYIEVSGGDKVLSFDVVGDVTSPNYPSGNLLSAQAKVSKNSDGTFKLMYPRPSGTQYDRTFKSESSAMKSGRTALRNFVNKQYGNKESLSQASRDTLRGIEQGARQRQRRNEANRRAVRRGMGL